tara:strand:- start:415 stop:921 length:507 start_codon:yes stop_codon:yes gene_type:complete
VLHAVEHAVAVSVNGIEDIFFLDADTCVRFGKVRVVLYDFLEVQDHKTPEHLEGLGAYAVVRAVLGNGPPNSRSLKRAHVVTLAFLNLDGALDKVGRHPDDVSCVNNVPCDNGGPVVAHGTRKLPDHRGDELVESKLAHVCHSAEGFHCNGVLAPGAAQPSPHQFALK